MLDIVTFINPIWYSIENFILYSIFSDLHRFCCWWSFYINIIIPNICLQNIVIKITIRVNPTSFLCIIYWKIYFYIRWQLLSLKAAFHQTSLILNKLELQIMCSNLTSGLDAKNSQLWEITWLLNSKVFKTWYIFCWDTNLSSVGIVFTNLSFTENYQYFGKTLMGVSALPTDLQRWCITSVVLRTLLVFGTCLTL